jgi:hypothetical protein
MTRNRVTGYNSTRGIGFPDATSAVNSLGFRSPADVWSVQRNHSKAETRFAPALVMKSGKPAGRVASRRRSVPEILEPLGVASIGLAPADADHVKTFRAGLERADDCRSDAQHIPR